MLRNLSARPYKCRVDLQDIVITKIAECYYYNIGTVLNSMNILAMLLGRNVFLVKTA